MARSWRRCAVLALCGALACRAPAPRGAPSTQASPADSARAPPLRLVPSEADVFAFQLDVRIDGAGVTALRGCELWLRDGRRLALDPARPVQLALYFPLLGELRAWPARGARSD